MTTDPSSDSTFLKWYRERITEPTTEDEAYGYWVFVVGVLAGILGILVFLVSGPATGLRELSIVLSSGGLVLLLAGPIIRLPLRRLATTLTYGGVIIAALAIVWFIIAFPANWSVQTGETGIIGLYSLGLVIIAIGGVFVPVLTAGPETEAVAPETDTESAERQALQEEVNELRSALADTEADESDLAAQLRLLRASQSRFELYEDRGGEWRWRLRHRNGNILADSSEGYTRRHDAQRGIQSVRRNALGATFLLIESEEELVEEGTEFEPFREVASNATFELYEDRRGEFRWRLVHENGNILADSGEGYSSRNGVQRAINGVKGYVGPADYLRIDPTAFEVYRDRAGEWRWRLIHENGNILADSGEGYSNRSGVRRALDRIRERLDDMEFEVYEDESGEFRWRLRGGNNQIMADSGEGYTDRGSVDDAVERVQQYVPDADVLELGRAAFELYEDEGDEWRWRLRHRNGNILADSGEGYSDRSGARDGIESVKRNAPNAELQESESDE